MAFETIVTVLENPPILLVSYLTFISPLSPGKIGLSGFVGTVHPQLPFTFSIISGLVPTLVKRKTLSPFDPLSILP